MWKNGHTRHGKQNHLCKNCERQFSAGATNRLIAAERRAEIANLLRERLSLRGICRAVGVSLTWLLHFMVERFATCPDHLEAIRKLFHSIAARSCSILAVMKRRATARSESIQHKMDMTDLDHGSTRAC
jgi:hypothetical protein